MFVLCSVLFKCVLVLYCRYKKKIETIFSKGVQSGISCTNKFITNQNYHAGRYNTVPNKSLFEIMKQKSVIEPHLISQKYLHNPFFFLSKEKRYEQTTFWSVPSSKNSQIIPIFRSQSNKVCFSYLFLYICKQNVVWIMHDSCLSETTIFTTITLKTTHYPVPA